MNKNATNNCSAHKFSGTLLIKRNVFRMQKIKILYLYLYLKKINCTWCDVVQLTLTIRGFPLAITWMAASIRHVTNLAFGVAKILKAVESMGCIPCPNLATM